MSSNNLTLLDNSKLSTSPPLQALNHGIIGTNSILNFPLILNGFGGDNNNNNNNSISSNHNNDSKITLEQVEKVLQTLFTHTDSAVQNEANKWLLELQNDKNIVPMCLELIKVNQPFFSQFFGIQTLYSKVHSDWESRWTDEFRINIKNTVFNRFLFDKDNNQVFNGKICSCIAAIMIHSIPKVWENAINDLLNLLHSNQSTDRIKKGTLDILTILPIEFESVVLSNTRRMLIKETFKANSDNIIASISEYLSKGLNNQLNILLLKCVRNWIRFGDAKSVLKCNLLTNIFKVLENHEILGEGLSLIGDLINFHTYISTLTPSQQSVSNSVRIHSKDLVTFDSIMIPIIRKIISLKDIYDQAIQDDELFICRAFAETLSQIVECYAPLMIETDNSDIQQCLSYLLKFCLHPNREVSELTFNAWSYLGEHFENQESIKVIYAQLLQILIEKSSYPADFNRDSEDEEIESDIMDYRNNVCDIIVTCFVIIGADEFIKYINNLLKNKCKTWQSYEVVIYVFDCISTNIIEDTESDGIAYQLTSEIISYSLDLPHHDILSSIVIRVLDDFNEFIYNQNLLVKSFNYILSIIQYPQTRTSSLKLLEIYTEKYPDVLYSNVEITLKTLENFYAQLDTDQQKLFIESILNLSIYINYNQKPAILQRLLNPIITSIRTVLSSNVDHQEKIQILLSKISLLESSLNFGEDSVPLFKEFIIGIWSLLEEIQNLSIQTSSLELSNAIWKIYWKIVHDLGPESMPNIDSIFNYILATIKNFPTITSSFYEALDLIINLYGKNTNFLNYIQNVINNLISCSLPTLVKNNNEAMSTIERFFKCLVRTLEIHPNLFYSSQYALNIMDLSVQFLLNSERESVLSVLVFYQQLFIKMNTHTTLINNYTKPILSNLLLAIVKDSTRLLTINFSDLLFEWILRYPESKAIVIECILNASWLPSETPQNEKERLARIIISLNNKAKFKSLISDISQVCNNLMTWDIFLSYEIK